MQRPNSFGPLHSNAPDAEQDAGAVDPALPTPADRGRIATGEYELGSAYGAAVAMVARTGRCMAKAEIKKLLILIAVNVVVFVEISETSSSEI